MRIENSSTQATGAGNRASEVEQTNLGQSRNSAATTNRGGDSVQLSGTSLTLHNFQANRAAKLERLSQAVQSGSYAVNPARVSQALVNETVAQTRSGVS